MTHLTEEETYILRATLGLSHYEKRVPQRNYIYRDDKTGRTIDKLVERDFLVQDSLIGQGGREIYYKATDAGRIAVLDAPWKG